MNPPNRLQLAENPHFRELVERHLDRLHDEPRYSPEQEAAHVARIGAALKARDAVLVAHYYTDPVLQALAEETGG